MWLFHEMRLNTFHIFIYTLFFKKINLLCWWHMTTSLCLLATWIPSLVSEACVQVFCSFFSIICRGFFIYSGYYSFMSCVAKFFPSLWLVFSLCWYLNILICSNILIFPSWLACFIFHLKNFVLSPGHEYGWYFLLKCIIVLPLTLRFHPMWNVFGLSYEVILLLLYMVTLLFLHCLLKRPSFPYCFEVPLLLDFKGDLCKNLLLDFLFFFIGLFFCQYTLFSLH